MERSQLLKLLRGLPAQMTYPYYSGREDAWLLAHLTPGDARVADLRKAGLGKLLDRPLIRPVIAGCGGTLRLQDVLALAYAPHALDWRGLSAAAQAQLNAVYADPWLDFELSFAEWGTRAGYSWQQTSRPGCNLVVQLGFPSEHATLMGRYMARGGRKAFEEELHPVRLSGRPTLAWARIDYDPSSGIALIEEVQSDWLRFVREEVAALAEQMPRARATRSAVAYEAEIRRRYDKLWPRVMLLAAIELLRDQMGCAEIYMHRPGTGAVLKHIHGRQPPQSLYSALPKSFGFAQTRHIPAFLGKRHRELRRALPRNAPAFWHLAF